MLPAAGVCAVDGLGGEPLHRCLPHQGDDDEALALAPAGRRLAAARRRACRRNCRGHARRSPRHARRLAARRTGRAGGAGPGRQAAQRQLLGFSRHRRPVLLLGAAWALAQPGHLLRGRRRLLGQHQLQLPGRRPAGQRAAVLRTAGAARHRPGRHGRPFQERQPGQPGARLGHGLHPLLHRRHPHRLDRQDLHQRRQPGARHSGRNADHAQAPRFRQLHGGDGLGAAPCAPPAQGAGGRLQRRRLRRDRQFALGRAAVPRRPALRAGRRQPGRDDAGLRQLATRAATAGTRSGTAAPSATATSPATS
jgi:hypothetical protein